METVRWNYEGGDVVLSKGDVGLELPLQFPLVPPFPYVEVCSQMGGLENKLI